MTQKRSLSIWLALGAVGAILATSCSKDNDAATISTSGAASRSDALENLELFWRADESSIGRAIAPDFVSEPTGGQFSVAGSSYSARTTANGWRFQPHLPALPSLKRRAGATAADLAMAGRGRPKADPRQTLRWQTVQIRAGSPLDQSGSWETTGNTAQRDWGSSVVEHLYAGDGGIEQTWILKSPGSGDFVVKGQFQGMTSVAETASGRHFARADGVAQVRYGKPRAVDSAGTELPIAAAWGGSGALVTFTVSAADMAGAQFPIAIDPSVISEYQVDQPVSDGSTPQVNPAVATNTDGSSSGCDRSVVVWEDYRSGDVPTIFASRITTSSADCTAASGNGNGNGGGGSLPSLTLETPDGYRVSQGLFGGRNPDIAYRDGSADDFLVVYERDVPGENRSEIRAAILSKTTDNVTHFGAAISGVNADATDPSVACDGSNCFVSWTQIAGATTDVFGARINGTGTPTPSTPATVRTSGSAAGERNSDVAASSSGFVVAYENGSGGISYSDLSTSGSPEAVNALSNNYQGPSVAYSSGAYLIAFSEIDGSENEVRGQRVNSDGTPWGSEFTIRSRGGNAVYTAPDVSAFNGAWLVAYVRTAAGSELKLTSVDSGGGTNNEGAPSLEGSYHIERLVLAPWYQQGALIFGFGADISATANIEVFGQGLSADTNDETSEVECGAGTATQRGVTVGCETDCYVSWVDSRSSSGPAVYVEKDASGSGTQSSAYTGTALNMAMYQNAPVISYYDDKPTLRRLTTSLTSSWVHEFNYSGANSARTDVAVQSNGNIAMIWDDRSSSSSDCILGIRTAINGAVENGLSVAGSSDSEIECTVGASSNTLLVAWVNEDDSEILGRIYDGTLRGEFTIAAAGGSERRPDVATLPNGDFVVVWDDTRTAGKRQIYTATVSDFDTSPNTPQVSTAQQLGTTSDEQLFARIASGSMGAPVVWQQGTATNGYEIGSHVIDTSGNTYSDAEELFNTANTTDIDAQQPTIAVLGTPGDWFIGYSKYAVSLSPAVNSAAAYSFTVDTDSDGDSYGYWEDCNDASTEFHPGAPEIVDDGIDQDCDMVDSCYGDNDGDGFYSDEFPVPSNNLDCSDPGEVDTAEYNASPDCDDTTANCTSDCTNADGDAHCAPFDCDDSAATGSTCATTCSTFFADTDSDTFGDLGSTVQACAAPNGYVASNTDCDDSNANCTTDCTNADGDSHCAPFDCDDSAATGGTCTTTCSTFYADVDSDSFGNPGVTAQACVLPSGYVASNTDCDDSNANCTTDCTNADGDSHCAPFDCDDSVATGGTCTTTCSTFYVDSDSDFYGDPSASVQACTVPTGHVANSMDCDDDLQACGANCKPGGVEICDDYDNDCNSAVDDNPTDGTTYYADADSDTYGDENGAGTEYCPGDAPAGVVADNSDCDDSRDWVHDGATEIVGNAVDEDCNGKVLCYFDDDNDGYGQNNTSVESSDLECVGSVLYFGNNGFLAYLAGDCDDNPLGCGALSNPGAAETIGDGCDNDCDGVSECFADFDSDGFVGSATVDSSPWEGSNACAQRGAPAVAGQGLVQDDCDDTVATGGSVHPGADESCNDIDDDCDGVVDEDPATGGVNYYTDWDDDDYTVGPLAFCSDPGSAYQLGSELGPDCDDDRDYINPGMTEVVGSGFDENCDGQNLCYDDQDQDGWGSAATVNTGADGCNDPSDAPVDGDCDDIPAPTGCGDACSPGLASDPGGFPAYDNDCNAIVLCYQDLDGDGYGSAVTIADNGNSSCNDGTEAERSGDCDDDPTGCGQSCKPPTPPSTGWDDTCDGNDDDCDGQADEDGACAADPNDTDLDGFTNQEEIDDASLPPNAHLNPNIYPGAPELCDGIDNNGVGGVDESLACGGCQ